MEERSHLSAGIAKLKATKLCLLEATRPNILKVSLKNEILHFKSTQMGKEKESTSELSDLIY